jgi:uncharacterized repeat protein (TIGR02543 family)
MRKYLSAIIGTIAAIAAISGALSACKNPLAAEAKAIRAETASPRLVVSTPNGTVLANGGSYDFGVFGIGDAKSLTLTIANIGKTALSIADNAVTIPPSEGTGSGIFNLAQKPASSIAVGAKDTLIVSVSSTSEGMKSATLTIASNDVAAPTFSIRCLATINSAPRAPTSLTAAAGISQVTLTWASVAEATSYNLYWATGPDVTKANGTELTSIANPYAHLNLTIGTTYYYVVTAVNADGESAISNEAYATVVGAAPNAPTNVAATAGNGTATVTWTAADTATTYNIYWGNSSGVTKASPNKISGLPGTQNSYTHSGLTNGSSYFYIVTAVNSGGESMASNQTSAFPEAPALGAPTGFAGVSGNGTATLSWTANGADTYTVYWSTTAGTKTGGVAIPMITATTYTHNVTNGITYYYVVTSTKGGVESAASLQIGVTPQAPPGPGTNLAASASFGQITLTWDPPSTGTASSYNVYWSTDAAVSKAKYGSRFTNITSTTYSNTSPSAGILNYYVVTALNSGGESAVSGTASALAIADAPTGVSATASETQVTLIWTAPAGQTVDQYEVYGSHIEGFTPGGSNRLASVLSTNPTTYTHAGLTRGDTWYYGIKASNASGLSSSSSQAYATVLLTVTFDMNEPDASTPVVSGSMPYQSILPNATTALSANAYAKQGYTFLGWATGPTAAVSYADGASYTMGAANATLYAKWSLNPAIFDTTSYWDVQKWAP